MELRIKNKTIGQGKPIICVPIMKSSKEEICREAERLVEQGTEMIEWRVDAFEDPTDGDAVWSVLKELGQILSDVLFVCTFRSKKQGGLLELPQEKVYEIHQIAAKSGAVDLIDVEYFVSKNPEKEIRALKKLGAHVIASHHDFDETPQSSVMEMLLTRMQESGADVVKLAVMPQKKQDVLALLTATEDFRERFPDTPMITMSMGALGMISRVAGEVFGSCVTFGAGAQASAPGQLPMEDLKRVLSILHNGIKQADGKA